MKRKFIFKCLGFKYEFYAQDWQDAQEIIMDMVDEEERPMTKEEYLESEADAERKEA